MVKHRIAIGINAVKGKPDQFSMNRKIMNIFKTISTQINGI